MNDGAVPAVVLAAGVGQRLSPLTNTRPKPMVPVANRPLLEYVVEALAAAGIDDIVLVVGYQQERIRNHFGDGDDWDVSITYVEQSTRLGTGHAVLQAEPVVDGRFLVLNGDRIIEPSLIDRMQTQPDTPTVAITQVAFPSTFGVVDIDNDRLAEIEEKPLDPSPSAQINAGVYLFDTTIFDEIRTTETVEGEIPITATLDRLGTGVRVLRYDDTWLDVTYLWDILPVNASRIPRAEPTANDTVGRPGSAIAQDVVLDTDVDVGTNATISGSTAIGQNVRIGPNAVLENAIVFPDAEIGAGSILRDVIVGANVTIEPNVTVAGGEADVPIDGVVHEDVTLGAVFGDNAEIGGGSVLAPGTVIGNGVTVESGCRLDGSIPPEATVRRG